MILNVTPRASNETWHEGENQWRSVSAIAVALLICLAPAMGWTVDGVVEINQARVNQGGVTTGDAPGFPATIDESGSYRLTGDLYLGDEDETGIEITASDVTVDFNGFAIIGTMSCSGSPVSCTPTSGSGSGVVSSGSITNITIANGTIRGVGSRAINVPHREGRVLNMRIIGNGGTAVAGGSAYVVTGCMIRNNRGYGIDVGSDSRVVGNTIDNHTSAGIDVSDGCIIADNTVTECSTVGINGSDSNRIVGNTVNNCGGTGINGGGSALLDGNVITFNGGWGVELSNGSCYTNNVIYANGSGSVTGAGTQLGSNYCGSGLCP